MITGYNTDVEYGGVVYHVQTEDKGLDAPIILTLVYTGGAILASKRAPYDDLIASGFDEAALTKRLQRQHKLICAAVHAGRIEDLKRMSEREPSLSSRDRGDAPVRETPSGDEFQPEVHRKQAVDQVAFSEPDLEGEALAVQLLKEPELRSGQAVTLRLRVTGPANPGRKPVGNALILVKTLGTTFPPQAIRAVTDDKGIAVVSTLLPEFEGGRAAILIKVESNGETAELRRIILPAES